MGWLFRIIIKPFKSLRARTPERPKGEVTKLNESDTWLS